MCSDEINEEKERVWQQYLWNKPIIQFRQLFGRSPTKQEVALLRNKLEKTK